MSNRNITVTEAPSTEPLVTPDLYLNKTWLQTITDMNGALEGSWGPLGNSQFTVTVPNSGYSVMGKLMGDTMFVNILIEAPTGSGTITWTAKSLPFSAEFTVLDTWEFTTRWSMTDGSSVEDKVITIPSSTANRLLIKGLILRK